MFSIFVLIFLINIIESPNRTIACTILIGIVKGGPLVPCILCYIKIFTIYYLPWYSVNVDITNLLLMCLGKVNRLKRFCTYWLHWFNHFSLNTVNIVLPLVFSMTMFHSHYYRSSISPTDLDLDESIHFVWYLICKYYIQLNLLHLL